MRGCTAEGPEASPPEGVDGAELEQWRWKGDVLFAVAGAAAEEIRYGYDNYNRAVAAFDERDFVHDPRGQLAEISEPARAFARDVLRSRWLAVERLADRLLTPPVTLHSYTATDIIHKALGTSEMDGLFDPPAPRLTAR